MRTARFTSQRYQLKKEGVRAVIAGHPWVYRGNLSTAVDTFKPGQWLCLVDHANQVQGYGIYEPVGPIGIRILKRGSRPVTLDWIQRAFGKALLRRAELKKFTDSYRVIHGENDGFPGIVIDKYERTLVLQTYSSSVDALGRYLVSWAAREFQAENVIWKPPSRRRSATASEKNLRVLKGKMPGALRFREGKLNLAVEIAQGQKSGTFLDLRGLRKWISLQKLSGKRVLNLFCYNGTLGLAAEVAGADEVWNVDISEGALAAARKLHHSDKKKAKFIQADVFAWLDTLPKHEKFDLIIVDPPSMASRTEQVPGALKAYRSLYRKVLPHLSPRGKIVAGCCTSRIRRNQFLNEVQNALGNRVGLFQALGPEDDHPVSFPEGDYLKLYIFQDGVRRSAK